MADSLLREIEMMHEAMRLYAYQANVSQTNYDKIIFGINDPVFPINLLEFIHHGLKRILDGEFDRLYKVYNSAHINPDMWRRLEAMGKHNLPEQILLRDARRSFKQSLKTFVGAINDGRPKKSKRKDPEVDENADQTDLT